MASITPTNDSLLTQTLPAAWTDWFPVIDVAGTGGVSGLLAKDGHAPMESPFPEDVQETNMPVGSYRIGADFDNTDLNVTYSDMTLASVLGWSGVGFAAGASLGIPFIYQQRLRRLGNSGSMGAESFYLVERSPRLGFSIGNMFKHQGYVAMDIYAVGWAILLRVVWLTAVAISWVEYAHNSRLKYAQVQHGKIISTRTEANPAWTSDSDPSVPKSFIYFKILDTVYPSPSDASLSGNINIYTSDGQGGRAKEIYEILGITDNWEIKAAEVENRYSGTNDFYTLDNLLIVSDPSLFHEYGLATTTDPVAKGTFFTTKEQKFIQNAKVFVAAPDEQTDETWKTLRVVVGASDNLASGAFGRGSTQNFCAGNLTGEFMAIYSGGEVSEVYEIVGHPRANVIDITNTDMISNETQLFVPPDTPAPVLAPATPTPSPPVAPAPTPPKDVTILQRKFWCISEMFLPTSPPSGQPDPLWEGEVSQVTVTTTPASSSAPATTKTRVKWDTRATPYGLAVASDEAATWSSKDLLERFKTNVTAGLAPRQIAYKKFSTWKLVRSNTGTPPASYDISSLVSLTFGSDKTTIEVEVEQDLSSVIKAGSGTTSGTDVHVYLDEANPTLFASPEASINCLLNCVIARDDKQQYAEDFLWMTGYYDTGFRKADPPITKDAVVSLVSYSFGTDIYRQPYLLCSVDGSRYPCVAACSEGCDGPREMVFVTDRENSILFMRISGGDWDYQIRQAPVRIGVGHKTPNSDTRYVTEMGFTPPSNGRYWLVVPSWSASAASLGPYNSFQVSGDGGISTEFSRVEGLTFSSVPSGTSVPIEYAMVKPTGSATSVPVVGSNISVLCKASSSGIIGTAGAEPANKDKFKAIMEGQSVAGSISLPPASYTYGTAVDVPTSVNLFDAHYASDGEMCLVYGAANPECKNMLGSGDPVIPKQNVYILKSRTRGLAWGAYHLPPPTGLSTDTEREEWGHPVAILYDFLYMGSYMDLDSGKLWVFGYSYDRDHDGDSRYLSLCMYRLVIPLRFETPPPTSGETPVAATSSPDFKKMITTGAIPSAATAGLTHAWYRQPKAKTGCGSLMEGTVETASSSYGFEEFVKIFGGGLSGADVLMTDTGTETGKNVFDREIVGVSGSSSTMYLYFRHTEKGVMNLVSNNYGDSWGYPGAEGVDPVVTIEGAQAPCSFEEMLFYFTGDSMMALSLKPGTEQSSPFSMASGVDPQKIAALRSPQGKTRVFYRKKGGVATCLESPDNGQHWHRPPNW